MTDAATIAKGLSQNSKTTIRDGGNDEWYAVSDRASDDLAEKGLVRRPFSHDRRICIPTYMGLLVRAELEKNNG